MSRFASGKDAYGISDRSGFRYRLVEMVTEWNGSKVGRDEYEAKHPQLEPIRVGPDPQAIHDPRPDQRTEVTVARLLPSNPLLSGSSGSAVITVIEPSHGRITVTDANLYTFTASSGTATTGGQRGGGENATAGPVTLET